MDDGLQILKQVGLTPPAEGHLLMYAMWLKEAAHTHNTAWAESRQLIDQAEEEIARLNEMSQLQKVISTLYPRQKKTGAGARYSD